jgi:hypothetical protein
MIQICNYYLLPRSGEAVALAHDDLNIQGPVRMAKSQATAKPTMNAATAIEHRCG